VKVCQCTIIDVRQTVTLFEDLLIQNWMVHSPTHSPMTRTIDPLSPMMQSMQSVCVRVCMYAKVLLVCALCILYVVRYPVFHL